jgi:hypothetical protein
VNNREQILHYLLSHVEVVTLLSSFSVCELRKRELRRRSGILGVVLDKPWRAGNAVALALLRYSRIFLSHNFPILVLAADRGQALYCRLAGLWRADFRCRGRSGL